jgi:hypothetical protein
LDAPGPQHSHRELPIDTRAQPGPLLEGAVQHVNPTLELQAVDFKYSAQSLRQRPFSDAEELELAAELLGVTTEAELEQFLGNLIQRAWKGIKTVGSQVLRPLGGVLKTVAKAALPLAATAAGTFFGGPAGGAIAGKLGSLVSQALEAEAAELVASERDLEKCRQFVRMAGQTARAAALAPAGTNPIAVAEQALAKSAQEKLTNQFASNIAHNRVRRAASSMSTPVTANGTARRGAEAGNPLHNKPPCSECGQLSRNCKCGAISRSGRWMRHGRSIVVVNC